MPVTHCRHGVTYTLVGAITAAGMPGLEQDQAAWCAAFTPPLHSPSVNLIPRFSPLRRDAARVRLLRAAEAASDLGCGALCRAA